MRLTGTGAVERRVGGDDEDTLHGGVVPPAAVVVAEAAHDAGHDRVVLGLWAVSAPAGGQRRDAR